MSIRQRLADSVGRTSLWLVACLPFLNPVHSSPIPSFYSEWLAAALGIAMICCCAVTAPQAGKLRIPLITLLPLGLTAVVLIQLAFDHVSHPRYALLYCCFLLLASALMIVGRLDSDRLGLERMAGILASAFLAGALIQALLLALQRAGLPIPWIGSSAPAGTWSGGLLGQRNHLVDYLWLGVASAMYLIVKQKMSATLGGVLVIGLAVASVLPGSRSAFLYPVGLAAVSAFAWQRSNRFAAWRKVAIACLLSIPAMIAVDQWPGNRSASSTTATERLTAPELDPVRSGLLQVAWLAAIDRPLSGYGVGAAPAVTFERAATWPEKTHPVVAEHFHNLLAQWLVEFGLPLSLAAVAFTLYWLGSAVRDARLAEHWWILSLLTVIGLHSQLEYPLWLIYFLAPISLLMGALSSPALEVSLRPRHIVEASLAISLACLILTALSSDYRELERLNATESSDVAPNTLMLAMESALEIEKRSLLAPNAVLFVATAMGVSKFGAEAKWALCEQALRISPKRVIVVKCAAIAGIVGNQYGATRLMNLGSVAYANELPAILKEWKLLTADFEELNAFHWVAPKQIE